MDAITQTIKLLPKQFQFLNSTKKEIGYIGGYGSGKSRVLAYKVLKQALIPNNLVLLTRKTLSALKDSTLRALLMPDGNLPPILPNGSYEYNVSRNMINIHGGGCILALGCDDPMRVMSINAGFIAIDEASELDLEEYLALKGRLRNTIDPIRGIAFATNPKSTNHWIYKRFYQEVDDERLLITAKTTENKYLPSDYIADLNKLTGVNYKRYVLGEFANNEGAVYSEFNNELHIKEKEYSEYDKFIISADMGFTDNTAILVTGYNDTSLHIYNEIVTNKLTPTEIADKIKSLQDIYTFNKVVIDKSAKGTITQCEAAGINVIISNSDIDGGILRVKELLIKDKISFSKTCEETIKEFDMYSFKMNSDKPEDKFNHCFIAGTKIDTINGKKDIEDINLEDLILTRKGYKRVLKTFEHEVNNLIEVKFNNGEELIGTPEHPFIIPQNKIARMDALRYNSNVISKKTIIGEDICETKLLDGMDIIIEDILNQLEVAIETIFQEQIVKENQKVYIEQFGNLLMELYQKDITYITLMEILQIIELKILNYLLQKNITVIDIKLVEKDYEYLKIEWKQLDHLQKNGMDHQKELNGINNTLKNKVLELLKVLKKYVNVAEKNMLINLLNNLEEFVQIVVNQNLEENKELTIYYEPVNAVNNSKLINIQKLNIVQVNAVKTLDQKNIKVYNLNIEDCHEYFANNILVHNCMDSLRYMTNLYFDTSKNITPHFSFEEDTEDVNNNTDKLYNTDDQLSQNEDEWVNLE